MKYEIAIPAQKVNIESDSIYDLTEMFKEYVNSELIFEVKSIDEYTWFSLKEKQPEPLKQKVMVKNARGQFTAVLNSTENVWIMTALICPMTTKNTLWRPL